MVVEGVNALVSFGLAGGLDPALRPGRVIIPATIRLDGSLYPADLALARLFGGVTGHSLLAGTTIAVDAATKRRLYSMERAHAIDLESGSVARIAEIHDLPFVAVRAICDPAERDLPPAAVSALDLEGDIGLIRVLRSLLRDPGQIPALLAVAADAARARRALIGLATAVTVQSAGRADSRAAGPGERYSAHPPTRR